MRLVMWALALGALGAIGYTLWRWRRNWLERRRAAEERFTSFIAKARPAVPAVEAARPVDESLPQQKLLLEAAAKAAAAGEPALSIQLYARLIARYPDSAFGAQARAAVEAQKEKLAKR